MPATCVDRIRDVATVTVQGNHDRTVDTPMQYAGNPMARAGLECARNHLSDEQRRWLRELPETATFGDEVYLVAHSHPEHRDQYVFPEQFPDLRPLFDEFAGIVLGHTHIQHKTTIDDRLIINPGSVGQPRDGDPRAAYAVLDTETNDAELRRTRYNIDRVHHQIVVEGLPEAAGERLFEGE